MLKINPQPERFTVDQAVNGGYAITNSLGVLMAVAQTRAEVADYFHPELVPVYRTPDECASDLVACFQPSTLQTGSIHKIAAIKMVRNVTRCGLREAKDAVENAIRRKLSMEWV